MRSPHSVMSRRPHVGRAGNWGFLWQKIVGSALLEVLSSGMLTVGTVGLVLSVKELFTSIRPVELAVPVES